MTVLTDTRLAEVGLDVHERDARPHAEETEAGEIERESDRRVPRRPQPARDHDRCADDLEPRRARERAAAAEHGRELEREERADDTRRHRRARDHRLDERVVRHLAKPVRVGRVLRHRHDDPAGDAETEPREHASEAWEGDHCHDTPTHLAPRPPLAKRGGGQPSPLSLSYVKI